MWLEPSVVRSGIAILLRVSLPVIWGACDRQSGDTEQENAQATAVQKSENSSGGESTFSPAIDTSHAGETAPDFPFQGPDGEDVTLADFRVKPLLVNLWAPWCGPCVIELPRSDERRVGKA